MAARRVIARAAVRAAAFMTLGACVASSATREPGARTEMPSPLGVNVQNVDRPYEIRGRTATELSRQIRALGAERGGRRWAGELTWALRYTFGRTAASFGGCAAGDMRVMIETVTTLPRWVDADSADAGLRAQWGVFLAALRLHEDGHRRIALEAATAVRQRLEGLRGTDCRNYAAEAQFHVDRLMNEYNKRNADYDATTRHGFTQGTIWPPRPGGPEGRSVGSRTGER